MGSSTANSCPVVCCDFNSVKGCYRGQQCRYLHEIKSVQRKVTRFAPPDRVTSADGRVATYTDEPLKTEFPNPGLCWFFETPQGCRRGEQCLFRHEAKRNLHADHNPVPNGVKDITEGVQTVITVQAAHDLRMNDSLPMPSVAGNAARVQIGENQLTTMFQLFNELPAELRLKIWGIALRQGYQAVLRLTHWRDESSDQRFVRRCYHPSLLSVCHESRVEALKNYTLSFGTSLSPPCTYFNFDHDMLVLNTLQCGEFGTFVDLMSPQDLGLVQNLTIKLRDWTNCGFVDFRDRIWKFKNLKRLSLLVSDREEDKTYSTNKWTASLVKEDLARELSAKNPGWVIPKVKISIVPGLKDYYNAWAEPPQPVPAPRIQRRQGRN